jgi:hypothetical protein
VAIGLGNQARAGNVAGPGFGGFGSTPIPVAPRQFAGPQLTGGQGFQSPFRPTSGSTVFNNQAPLITGGRGIAPSAAPVYGDILKMAANHGRPVGFLSAVMKVLSMGSSAVSGGSEAYMEVIDDHIEEHKGGFWDKIGLDLAPWEWITALGAGFDEVPTAIQEGHSFEETLKSRWNPDSWFYKHSRPIGLTMDIALDPTTYISFGATTPAKIAARNGLHAAWQKSVEEATTAIAKNKFYKGPGLYARDMGHSTVTMMEHLEAGRPWTLGDSLTQLRNSSMQVREEAIGGAEGLAAMGKALIPGVRAMGGQGIRFAGMELPYTPMILDHISGGIRRKIKDAGQSASTKVGERAVKPRLGMEDILKYNGGDLLPDDVVEGLMDDVLKTGAKTDFRQLIETNLGTEMKLMHDSLSALRDQTVKAVDELRVTDVGGTSRYSTRQEREVGFEALMTGGPIRATPKAGNVARQINANITRYKATVTERLVNEGWDETDVAREWDKAMYGAGRNPDPAAAVFDFEWRIMSQHTKNKFIDSLLKNPMYATRLRKKPTEKMGIEKAGEVIEREEDLSPFSSELDEISMSFHDPNLVRFKWRGETYAVRKQVHEAIDKFSKKATMDNELRKFWKAVGYPQQIWKIPATVMNPAFHIMNFVGAVWNNALAGVTNPVDYVKALSVVYKNAVEVASQANEGLGRRSLLTLGTTAKSTPGTQEAARTFSEAEARGGLGRSSFLFSDIYGEEGAAKRQLAKGESQAVAFGRKQLARKPGETKKRYGLRQARRGGAVAAFATGNVPAGVVLMSPEIAGVGRAIGGVMEDVVRLAPFMKYGKDKQLQNFIDQLGPIQIPNMVHPGFSNAEQTLMYNIGAQISKRFQFDYTDLSSVERQLKTVFPFWVYAKNNFLLQTEQLARQPAKVLTMQKLFNYVAESGEPLGDVENVLPNYFDNLGAFQIPVPEGIRKRFGLPMDQPLFLNPKLPYFSAFGMFPPLWDLARDTGETPIQKMGRIFSQSIGGNIGPLAPLPVPGAKLMIEAFANYNLGLGRRIDFQRASSNDVRNSYVPAPGWSKYLPQPLQDALGIFTDPDTKAQHMTATSQYVLNALSTPFVGNMGKAIPAGAVYDEKSHADMISWLTGIRLMPIDTLRLTRAWGYGMMNTMTGKKAELQERGLTLSPEDETMLRRLRAQLKVIERAYDSRAEEAVSG